MYTTDKRAMGMFLVPAIFCVISCTPVKPYQRVYLNDAAMRPGRSNIEKFDNSVHSIREGASGGGNGKASGGCGCN
jgi:hypothetical protein